MLAVRGAQRAIKFYEAAFGAVTAYRIEDPDGNVVARLLIGGAEFWVHDGEPSPDSLGGTPVRIVLTAPDPDAAFARAIAAGAAEIHGVCEAHGWRMGRLVDPYGHHWEVSCPVGDGPH